MPDLLSEAQALFDYTRNLRRDFHMHPELGFQEKRTAGIVARELQALGLEVSTGIGETGVVALIEGARPGPTLLLRFDMDALPIEEQTGAEYASRTPGVMHACGHDGHTAIGLTVARLLLAHRAELAGSVKLVFQPAEEGMGGAERMIQDGVLEHPRPARTLAMHLWNDKPLGWLGIAAGPVMAGAEIFTITLTGKGGHGASPHLSVDPIVAAAQVVTALQSIVSRNVDPLQTAVVTVGRIQAGTAFNIIPPSAEMTGTIRTFDPTVREMVVRRFEEIARGVAQAMGGQVEINLKRLTPAVINEPELTALVRDAARRLLPQAEVDERPYITMGSEDMAFFQEAVGGCFVFVGSANAARGLNYGHHHPRFDFDEQALPRGAALMAAAALDFLRPR